MLDLRDGQREARDAGGEPWLIEFDLHGVSLESEMFRFVSPAWLPWYLFVRVRGEGVGLRLRPVIRAV